MYGEATGGPRKETDPVGPITAYAKSKINGEIALRPLADDKFRITSLRFCTAFGVAPRLRLDLVINDFVASAVTTGKIEILSDGSPWRPLIHVRDMARALCWAVGRSEGESFVAVNVGKEENTWQIGQLAKEVAAVLGNVEVSINTSAAPDRRSYKVDFGLFRSLAPNHQPQEDFAGAINELRDALKKIDFGGKPFRQSSFVRLYRLRELQAANQLDNELRWVA
jgi:nucleoside-diphosphate-sugar epimerase